MNVISGVIRPDEGSVKVFGTDVVDLAPDFRAAFGLEVSRLLLGHTSAVTTEIYAEPDRAKAMAAMAAAG